LLFAYQAFEFYYMKQISNIRDMNSYTDSLNKSFADKRHLYTEFQTEQSVRGFDYTKAQFVKDKFPRFPNRLRKTISEFL